MAAESSARSIPGADKSKCIQFVLFTSFGKILDDKDRDELAASQGFGLSMPEPRRRLVQLKGPSEELYDVFQDYDDRVLRFTTGWNRLRNKERFVNGDPIKIYYEVPRKYRVELIPKIQEPLNVLGGHNTPRMLLCSVSLRAIRRVRQLTTSPSFIYVASLTERQYFSKEFSELLPSSTNRVKFLYDQKVVATVGSMKKHKDGIVRATRGWVLFASIPNIEKERLYVLMIRQMTDAAEGWKITLHDVY
uniref:Uncharacterized protein n=1 Tax=Arundo donax TaxID=35708 RepID=A0A0A9A2J2_ARUDO